jgi:hypothetical protein
MQLFRQLARGWQALRIAHNAAQDGVAKPEVDLPREGFAVMEKWYYK